MPRVLVIGAGGMLSTDVVEVLGAEHEVVSLSEMDLDIRERGLVADKVAEVNPDVLVNCAAYTDVDGCEDDADTAFAVNRDGAGNVAEAAFRTGATVIHISTDFVFDGKKTAPYTEEDPPGPISVYGQSKLEGDREVQRKAGRWAIVRTAWLFGVMGDNFVEKVIRWYGSNRPITVVDDQIGTPSYTVDVSRAIKTLTESDSTGFFNASNSGICSRFDFARGILKAAGIENPEIRPGKSSEFPTPATRPAYSALSSEKLRRETGFTMPDWEDALVRYFETRDEVHGPIDMETRSQ